MIAYTQAALMYRKIIVYEIHPLLHSAVLSCEGESELCDKRRMMVMMVPSSVAIGYVGEIGEDRQRAGGRCWR